MSRANAVCSVCGCACAPDQVLRLQGRDVCIACKPAFAQRLREGVGQPDRDRERPCFTDLSRSQLAEGIVAICLRGEGKLPEFCPITGEPAAPVIRLWRHRDGNSLRLPVSPAGAGRLRFWRLQMLVRNWATFPIAVIVPLFIVIAAHGFRAVISGNSWAASAEPLAAWLLIALAAGPGFWIFLRLSATRSPILLLAELPDNCLLLKFRNRDYVDELVRLNAREPGEQPE